MPTERLFKCGGFVATMILAITLTTVTFTTALGEDADVTRCASEYSATSTCEKNQFTAWCL
jgi:hypothetical protein